MGFHGNFNGFGLCCLMTLGNLPVEREKDAVCFFAAVWREPGVICYHIQYSESESDPQTRRPV